MFAEGERNTNIDAENAIYSFTILISVKKETLNYCVSFNHQFPYGW